MMSGVNDVPQDNMKNRSSSRIWSLDLVVVCSVLTLFTALIAVYGIKGQTGCGCCTCNCSYTEKDEPIKVQIAELEKRIEDLRLELQEAKRSEPEKTVVAEIKLPTQKQIKPGDKIIFTDPVFNIGNAYSTGFGFFEPPVSGTYSFSVTICIHPNTLFVFGLMKDNDVIDEVMAGDRNWHHCSTSTAAMYLTPANKVWVKMLSGTYNSYIDRDDGISSFTGVLINTFSP